MKAENGYSVHTLCLSAMFLISIPVMLQPLAGANELTLVSFAVAAVVAVILSIPLSALATRIFSPQKNNAQGLKKAALYVLYIFICIAAFADSVRCGGVFIGFVDSVILPHASKFLIAVVLFLSAVMLCRGHGSVVLKFSLFAGFATAAAIVLFFALSWREFRMENISLLSLPRLSPLAKGAAGFLLNVFAPCVLLYIYVGLHLGKQKRRFSVLGVIVGAVMLCAVLVNTMLLFGPELSGELEFPYASAISVITIGELFTRMDGVSYFIYFASTLVRLTVDVSIIRSILKSMGEKREKNVAIFFAAAAAFCGTLL